MVKEIKIHNFRCFEDITIQGFERINLMGGKNNSGKTALLEALYLNNSPVSQTIMNLRQIRGESLDFLKAVPEKAWDNLFFNKKETNRRSKIISEDDNGNDKKIEMVCDDSIGLFEDVIHEVDGEETEDLRAILHDGEYKRSVLNIYNNYEEKKSVSTSMIASSKGIIIRKSNIPDKENVFFIPAFLRLSTSALTQEFDKADLEGYGDEILRAVQLIDDSITQIKTLSIGRPSIYLKGKTHELLPITLFGEAVTRVIQFVLRIINNQHGILLIDEIENGIHYTNQHDLWRMLFKLSIEFDIQIFATTHSFEMIKAFSEVGRENKNACEGAYFEIARNIKTAQAIAIKREIEILNYEIKQKMEFRGE